MNGKTSYDIFPPSRQLVEAASWRLVAEILRRHPKTRVLESHPGGGQYDCLDLLLSNDPTAPHPCISLNRAGSVHFFLACGIHRSWEDFWVEYLGAPDPKEIIGRVCDGASLPRAHKLPPTTGPVLVFRFIAAFIGHAVLGRETWECRNGFSDSSDGCARRSDWFELFPGASNRSEVHLPTDISGEPARRFWFVCRDGSPRLCLEATGLAWDHEGTEYDLMRLYRKGNRLWPVVSFVARDLLP